MARSPFGRNGQRKARDSRGRFRRGNLAAAVVGEHSQVFWNEQNATVDGEIERIVRGLGHSATTAPETLLVAARGLAQAGIVRDAAFARMTELGGPLSAAGRPRRAFDVWLAASERVDRTLRVLGVDPRANSLTRARVHELFTALAKSVGHHVSDAEKKQAIADDMRQLLKGDVPPHLEPGRSLNTPQRTQTGHGQVRDEERQE